MKLLYIHQHFSIPSGATGTRSYEFAKRLVAEGHQVTILCGSFKAAKTGLTGNFVKNIRMGIVEGIEIIEIGVPYSNNLSFLVRTKQFVYFAYKASRLTLTLPYDLIYATTTPLTVAIPALVAKMGKRKPYIFEVRDLWPELPKAMGVIKNKFVLKAMDILETLAYKHATHCVALAPGISEGISNKLKKAPPISLIPNGCDTQYFSSGAKTQLSGFDKDDFICVFAGAHGLANGLDAVLDVAKQLKDQNKKIKFLFIGDGKLKPQLIERKNLEKLDNCIFWDPIPKNEIITVFKSVHIGLMILQNVPAFYFGTSPNKFFDYIASGLPVLNNYPGWLKNLIEENECGVAVEPDNINAFAEALMSLESNRERLNSMRVNALNLAVNSFDRDELAKKFIQIAETVYAQSCATVEKV